MIIVEGCDGTGKSTLVNRLSADLSLRIGKRGTDDRDKLYTVTRQDTYQALAHAVEGYHPPFVWDRLFFSEPIYSHIMGRPNAFNGNETMYVMAVLKALRCPIIICHVPLELARENMEKKHQMESVDANFDYIHGAYEGLVQRVVDWSIKYDYRDEESGGYEELLENTLKPYIQRRKDREWH